MQKRLDARGASGASLGLQDATRSDARRKGAWRKRLHAIASLCYITGPVIGRIAPIWPQAQSGVSVSYGMEHV